MIQGVRIRTDTRLVDRSGLFIKLVSANENASLAMNVEFESRSDMLYNLCKMMSRWEEMGGDTIA